MTQHPSVPDPAGSPTEPLPPLDSAENPTQPLPRPRPNGFFTWLRSLGIVRGEEDRWLGGVCSGIAARTGLDPVLVRGLFVVLGLFGGGLLLYGLAWALLPEPDGRIHAEEALRGTWTTGTTGALTAAILGTGPSIWWADDGLFGGLFWTLFSIAGVGLIVYWLVTRSGGSAARGSSATAASAPYTAQNHTAHRDTINRDTMHRDTMHRPAGSSARPAAATPRRPRTTPGAAEAAVVLGAVLITIGVILTLDYASVLDVGTPVAVALAAGAAVNGLGIVILGSLGRSSGVLGLTAIAALVGAGVTGTNMGTFDTVVVANDADWSPTSSSPATGGYTLAAADGHLDLRYLAGETDPAVEVPINLAASDLTVLVPDDVPVLVRADMFAGNVQINDGDTLTESGGLWKSADKRINDTAGEPLVLRITGVASNVLVTVNESELNQ